MIEITVIKSEWNFHPMRTTLRGHFLGLLYISSYNLISTSEIYVVVIIQFDMDLMLPVGALQAVNILKEEEREEDHQNHLEKRSRMKFSENLINILYLNLF